MRRIQIIQWKPISLLMEILLLFIYLTGVRYYLYENIYKAFNLGNLGAFGEKLQVSILLPCLMTVGVLLGSLLAFMLRNRMNSTALLSLGTVSGLLTLAFLFWTPYNLQLLMPSQIMQNLAMINCIAVMVFSSINVLVLSASVLCHLIMIRNFGGRAGNQLSLLWIALGGAGAVGMMCRMNSFSLYTGICGGILLLANIVHALIPHEDEHRGTPISRLSAPIIWMAVLIAGAIPAGAFWAERLIAY